MINALKVYDLLLQIQHEIFDNPTEAKTYFCGVFLKRKSSKADLVFPVDEHHVKNQSTFRNSKYIASILYNSPLSTLCVSLNRQTVLEAAFKESLPTKHSVITERKPCNVVCHLLNEDLCTIGTARSLMVSAFLCNLFNNDVITLNNCKIKCIDVNEVEEFLEKAQNEDHSLDYTFCDEKADEILQKLEKNVVNKNDVVWMEIPRNKPIKVKEHGRYLPCLMEAAAIISLQKNKDCVHVTSQREVVKEAVLLASAYLEKDLNHMFCSYPTTRGDTLAQWLKYREAEVRESYELKFGQQVDSDTSCWNTAINSVAWASFKLDILTSTKQLDPRKIDSRNNLFVLYNYSRICKLLRHFEEKVSQGVYPHLWNVNEIDVSLLTAKAEWRLFRQYILAYPLLLRDLKEAKGSIISGPSKLCRFLYDLSRDFSSYYHQTKVLLDGRDHLFPLMMTRMHLCISLQQVMEHSFQLLAVHPPKQM